MKYIVICSIMEHKIAEKMCGAMQRAEKYVFTASKIYD